MRHFENTNIYDWQFVIGRNYVSREMDNLNAGRDLDTQARIAVKEMQ